MKIKKIKLTSFIKALDLEQENEIFIEDGLICKPAKEHTKNFYEVNCQDCIIAPGFIDPQINGFGKCNFWDFPDFDEIDKLRVQLAYSGVVAFCPTIITTDLQRAIKLIEHINSYINQYKRNDGAIIIGIHLEGFFITNYGIHENKYAIKELNIKTIQPFIKENIAIFTLAPELDKTGEAIKLIQQNGILVSIGHSNASYCEGVRAIDEYGLNMVTHMFNGLKGIKGFHHRGENINIDILKSKIENEKNIDANNDGIILAILKNKNTMCSVIPDGIHVDKQVVKFLREYKSGNLFSLTTDLVASDFFQSAEKQGMLAGGQNLLNDCVSNLVNWGVASLEESLLLASRPISLKLPMLKNATFGKLSFDSKANLVIWNTKKNTPKGTIIGDNLFLSY